MHKFRKKFTFKDLENEKFTPALIFFLTFFLPMLLDGKILLPLPFMFFSFFFWTTGGGRKGPMKQGLSILLSILPSVWTFSRIVSLVFSKFWHGARNPYEVVGDRARFSWKKIFLPQKLGKWTKNGPKTGFLRIYWKLLSLIFTEFVL